MSRTWAMPNKNTFSIEPIGRFVRSYINDGDVIIDPFCNGVHATHTNDLNPDIEADFHLDVLDFLLEMQIRDVVADVVIFDPPYSPRQISEVYKGVGLTPDMKITQRPGRWKQEKDICEKLIRQGGIFLQFGWNSSGMGIKRGFDIEEILLVSHGAGHNDTICMAERKLHRPQISFDFTHELT